MSRSLLVPLAERARFDTLIDVRSPAEFALDHIPGAENWPVLDDAERARVGTLYAQVSAFEARKVGAALVARRLAEGLEQRWAGQPKGWKPLVYCWRGGQRSGSAVTVMRMVGWEAGQLQGGYKTWRQHVIELIAGRAPGLRWQVLAGPTGCGKTRLLAALAAAGAQVLDLEGLARHKGSVLGPWPDQDQPSQKGFETGLAAVLEGLDPARPVFVESESRRIGRLTVPEPLYHALGAAPVLQLQVDPGLRRDFLVADYAWLAARPEELARLIGRLQGLVAGETLARWHRWAAEAALPALVDELLALHYDPLYARSQGQHLRGLARAETLTLDGLDAASLAEAAVRLRGRFESR